MSGSDLGSWRNVFHSHVFLNFVTSPWELNNLPPLNIAKNDADKDVSYSTYFS